MKNIICVEGYKAFRGTMLWTPGNPAYPPQEIYGEWLYKPDANCWYCGGRSFPANTCDVKAVEYPAAEWISATEKPPSEEGWYLTLTKRTNGILNKPDSTRYVDGVWYTCYEVTHWLPIPKYP